MANSSTVANLVTAINQYVKVGQACHRFEQKCLAMAEVKFRRPTGITLGKLVVEIVEVLINSQHFQQWLAVESNSSAALKRYKDWQSVIAPDMTSLGTSYKAREIVIKHLRTRVVLHYTAYLEATLRGKKDVVTDIVKDHTELVWLYWLVEQCPFFMNFHWKGGKQMNRHARRLYELIIERRKPLRVLQEEFKDCLEVIYGSR